VENIETRKKLLARGNRDPEFAKTINRYCSADPHFFFNFFLVTYDPRKKGSKLLPFVTWPYQDESIDRTIAAMEDGCGLLSEKSRDMGVTYIKTGVFFHHWLYRDMSSFLLLSRKEDLVDTRNDPDSLLGKIDLYLKYLPRWIAPPVERRELHCMNLRNNSLISGESTNADAGRGGRRTATCADEFASVPNAREVYAACHQNTGSFQPVSTPKGRGNMFYELSRNPAFRKERLHWTLHPAKSRGLYTVRNNKLQIIDTSYNFPKEYAFKLDGKIRSPWYDTQEAEIGHPSIVAQELDIDYLGSDAQYFDSKDIDRIMSSTGFSPIGRGEVRNGKWCSELNGRLVVWMDPDDLLRLGEQETGNPWVVAADIAQGTGASNSVISIGHKRLKRKLGSFVSANVLPNDLAEHAVTICEWLGGAYLIWEANGAGRVFGNRVQELGYSNFYWHELTDAKSAGVTKAGFWTTNDNKQSLLGEYRRAILAGDYITHDKEELAECLDYIFTPNGGVVHMKSKESEDPSGANANHGDRVISSALLWKAMRGSGLKEGVLDKPEPPKYSPAWRMEQAAKIRRDAQLKY
jgi:hypothetical protein